MSFLDAAQLASAGANQIVAGHSAPGQAVNDGILALVSKPPAQAALPRPALMAPGKARYELLRNLHRAQPTGEIGNRAGGLMHRDRLFGRARLSVTATRYHNAQIDAVIKDAEKQPWLMAKADPGHNLRDAMAPASHPAQRRMATRYDVLKRMGPQPSGKTISLKQMPQLYKNVFYRTLKDVALAGLPPETRAVLKPIAAIAASLRPAPGAGKKRGLAYTFG